MRLNDLLPPYYEENETMQFLQSILSEKCTWLERMQDSNIAQCFISTADNLLGRWEKILAVESDLTMNYKQRREALSAKITGMGTTTREMIRNTAAAFSGGEVEVIEKNEQYAFIVRFVGTKGVPSSMPNFIRMLEEIKPAHLTYSFEYTYTVWQELKDDTWESISKESWDSLKISKEV